MAEVGESSSKHGVAPLSAGSPIGDDYRVTSVLSVDATSILYKADDRHLGISFCIKEYVPTHARGRDADGAMRFPEASGAANDRSSIDRFVREARALVRFHHPNIIRAHRVLECNNTAYIVLDFEETTTLQHWLEKIGRAPKQGELDRICGRLLEALAVVHTAGVIHRDIRPENVFLRSDLSPVLTGFAYAATADDDHDTTLLNVSSYLAPELNDPDTKNASTASDIYGLAAILYRAVTGQAPPPPLGRNVDVGHDLRQRAGGHYRESFLSAIAGGLTVDVGDRLHDVPAWLAVDTPVDPALAPTSPPQRLDAPGDSSDEQAQRLERFTTRWLTTFDRLPDPAIYAGAFVAKTHMPLAIATGFAGIVLYASGRSFALAAILQVVSIGLFWAGGMLSLYQFGFDASLLRELDLARRADEISKKAAMMAACILGVLALNPVFAGGYVANNPNNPVQLLSLIVSVPAVVLLLFVTTSAKVRGFTAWLFGTVVGLVGLFSLVLVTLYAFVLVTRISESLAAAPLANTYLFIVAPTASATMCGYLLIQRWRAGRILKKYARQEPRRAG